MHNRNHIARANRLVNKPKVVKPRKGKGSYKRKGKLVFPIFLTCEGKIQE